MGENAITCNRVPLVHVNTVFSKVSLKLLKGRDFVKEGKFKTELYNSIKQRGVLDPLLVWYLTKVPSGPKCGFLVRVGSSRVQICKEFEDIGLQELPCFVLNYQGRFKATKRNKGFSNPLVEGDLIDSREKALMYCFNKNIELRFSPKGWLVFAVSKNFLKIKDKY